MANLLRVFFGWWSWLKLIKWGTPILLVIAAIPLGLQWFRAPIAIEPISIDATATSLGISGEALADRIKSQISEINSEAGELFQTRKLGDATVPLDVKIGGWDITIEKLTKAYHLRLTSAHVTGHLSVVDQCAVLETTTSTGDEVRVSESRVTLGVADDKKNSPDKYHCRDLSVSGVIVPAQESASADEGQAKHATRTTGKSLGAEAPESLIDGMDARIECLGLRIVVIVSPDVAANRVEAATRRLSAKANNYLPKVYQVGRFRRARPVMAQKRRATDLFRASPGNTPLIYSSSCS